MKRLLMIATILWLFGVSMNAQPPIEDGEFSFNNYSIRVVTNDQKDLRTILVGENKYNSYDSKIAYKNYLFCNKKNGQTKWGVIFVLIPLDTLQRYSLIDKETIIIKAENGKSVKLLPFRTDESIHVGRNNAKFWKYSIYVEIDDSTLDLLCDEVINMITFNNIKQGLIFDDSKDIFSNTLYDFYLDARALIRNRSWVDWPDRIAKVKSEPMPKKLKEELESYDCLFPDLRKERLRELGIMGYIDAMAKFCEISLCHCYNPYTADWYHRIDNSTAEDIMPFLNAGKDQYADIQFYYACVLSGNYSTRDYYDSSEKLLTKEEYKYLDLPKAKEYFKKYLQNPNRKKRMPFGFDDDEIRERIKRAFPELIND